MAMRCMWPRRAKDSNNGTTKKLHDTERGVQVVM